jgi:hypothetical protein
MQITKQHTEIHRYEREMYKHWKNKSILSSEYLKKSMFPAEKKKFPLII